MIDNALKRYAAVFPLFVPLILFGMAQSFLGVSIPIIKASGLGSELVISAHFGLYAIGRILAGPAVTTLQSKSYEAVWFAQIERWAAFALLLSMIALMSAYSVIVTLPASFGIGIAAGVLHVAIQMRINRLGPPASITYFAEAYLWVSLGVFLFPFWLSLFLAASAPAFYSLFLPAVLTMLTAWFFRARVIPVPANKTDELSVTTPRQAGPSASTVLLALVAINSCFEWSFGFWGSHYAQARFSLSAAQSVAIMSTYLAMTVAGRLFNIWVMRLVHPLVTFISYAVIALAIIVGLVSTDSLTTFKILFAATGLLAGCLYPTNLALASATLGENFGAFVSRATVVGGLSLLLFPLLLGSLAQVIGIEKAFAIVSMSSLVAIMVLLLLLALSREQPETHGTGDRKN